MIFITSSGEIFLLFFHCQFFFFGTFHYIKKKKEEKLLQGCFWVAMLLLQESIFSGSKILKASNLGYVGKLTVIKWNT